MFSDKTFLRSLQALFRPQSWFQSFKRPHFSDFITNFRTYSRYHISNLLFPLTSLLFPFIFHALILFDHSFPTQLRNRTFILILIKHTEHVPNAIFKYDLLFDFLFRVAAHWFGFYIFVLGCREGKVWGREFGFFVAIKGFRVVWLPFLVLGWLRIVRFGVFVLIAPCLGVDSFASEAYIEIFIELGGRMVVQFLISVHLPD